MSNVTRALPRVTATVIIVLLALTGVAGAGNAIERPPLDPGEASSDRWVVGYPSAAEAGRGAELLGGELIPALNAVVVDQLPTAWASTSATYVEPEVTYQLADAPNDPEYPRQWQIPHAGIDRAWDLADHDGEGVTVAVIDTGYAPHPDLDANIVSPLSLFGDVSDTGDGHGHGTAVASIVGAVVDNGLDIAGACPNCDVMPIRVSDADGLLDAASALQAITDAADAGADVISLSFSGVESGQLERDAIAYARGKGAIVVAAAGNHGDDTPNYPAALPDVVGVAALDPLGLLADYSAYGDWVDVAAGGYQPVLSHRGSGHTSMQGTSMATPVVAAAIGLLIAEGVEDPVAALTSTARSMGDIAYGSIQVDDALREAGIAEEPETDPTESPSPGDDDSPPPTPSDDDGPVEVVDVGVEVVDGVVVVGFDASGENGFGASVDRVIITVQGREVSLTPEAAAAVALEWQTGTPYAAVIPVTPGAEGPLEVTIATLSGGEVTHSVEQDVTVDRRTLLAGGDLTDLSVTVAQATVPAGSVSQIMVSSAATFADALAASPFAQDGPILYTEAGADAPADQRVRDAVARSLGQSGACDTARVLLLGGVNAVGSATQDALEDDGWCVQRVQGASRVETALAVADATLDGAPAETVLLARADEWADAAAVGAWAASTGTPVLLTAQDGLHPAVAAWLEAHAPERVVLLGGTAALTDQVADEARALVADVTRVAGGERSATAVEITRSLWQLSAPEQVLVVDGWAEDGWAAALAASHPAARADAPVLYTGATHTPPHTAELLDSADWHWQITR